MAVTNESWSFSSINTSGDARVHIGHHNEYHDHRHYGDESQLSFDDRQRAREDAVLSSLSFADISARERTIDSPCTDTFKWIFEERVTEQQHYCEKDIFNPISRWLEHEHGMFLIVGKAGSGKSTFMRFLAGHKQTTRLLQIWATGHHRVLQICAHYFWCSGSQLQSSQEGLWRGVLHTIAKSDPQLASVVFADRTRNDGHTLAQLRSQPWARNDLISALSLLVAQLEVQKVAICLFIDGLDEYQGDEVMLITELQQLLKSPYIKICASTRPRNLFQETFGHRDHQWKLELHLLTNGDIVQLAATRLYEDEAFCKLVDCESRREELITTITDKSEGVFLWTVLVVREMIREVHQGSTIDELRERLDALPTELSGKDGLYQRIVERSDPRYRKYMAQLLLIMLEGGHQGVFWEDIHFLYDNAKDVSFATRECLGLDDKYRIAWKTIAEEATTQDWVGHDTSCRGLFMACHQGRSGAHPRGVNCGVSGWLVADTVQRVRKWCPDFVDTNDISWPYFLHRSVMEYLSVPEIGMELTELAGRGFDPVLTRCRLRLAHSRVSSGEQEMGHFERDFLRMVVRLDNQRKDFIRSILLEFERIQDTKWSFIPANKNEGHSTLDGFWAKGFCYGYLGNTVVLHAGFDISRGSQAHAWFLSLIASEGLVWYCREHWSRVPSSEKQATGIIIIAGQSIDRPGAAKTREHAELIQCVLRSGVDPNKKYTWNRHEPFNDNARRMTLSLWEGCIEAFPEIWTSGSDRIAWALEVVQMLLEDGRADKKCCLPKGKKSLLSALRFEPARKAKYRDRQRHGWNMFAGQLHEILDAHGLLTRGERHIAWEHGWLSKSATEPDSKLLARWARRFKGSKAEIRPERLEDPELGVPSRSLHMRSGQLQRAGNSLPVLNHATKAILHR